jgi:preprotein translocase subunit SecA
VQDWVKEEGIAEAEIRERMLDAANRRMAEKQANYGPELMRLAEKSVLLQVLDQVWKEHLLGLDHLRQGIGLRAYAQRDPLNEYKREAFALFENMLVQLRETVTTVLCHMEISLGTPEQSFAPQGGGETYESREDPAFAAASADAAAASANGVHPAAIASGAYRGVFGLDADPADVPSGWRKSEHLGRWIDPGDPGSWGKVPRNAACPCGSGRKYKHCHGRAK